MVHKKRENENKTNVASHGKQLELEKLYSSIVHQSCLMMASK